MITSIARVGLLVGVAVSPFLMPGPGGTDYTTLPLDPGQVESQIRAAPGDLAGAIKSAELVLGGVARSAEIQFDGAKPVAEVLVYGDGVARRATLDLADGKVMTVDDVPRFPGDPVEGEPQKTDSGLMYYDIVEGDGPAPAGPASTVKVHYTGWFVTGESFDSSVERGVPAEFPLNGVIPGWTEGVGSMRVGGKRKLIIPYALAYGEGGRPPVIPARATLIFDVELLEIVRE